jgi:UDP-glucose 4-epimerase
MTNADSSRILVVGGAGYVGSHTVLALVEHGYEVVVLDDFSKGFRELVPPQAILEEGDFGDPSVLSAVFRNYHFDAVMHFAAWACVPESVAEPMKYYVNNVSHTIRLLERMVESGCRRFILSSSAAIFGEPETTPILEDAPKRPTNPYGRTKLMMEQALADLAAAGTLDYVALRYFNAAGADPKGRAGELHDPETHLIPILLEVAAGQRPALSVCGTDYPTPDGTCVRDYVHVSDLAQAHLLALRHLAEGRGSASFNLGNGAGHSVNEVVEAVRRVTGRPVPVVRAGRRPGDPAVLVASSARAREVLGWRPCHATLEEIVRTAWEWKLRSVGRAARRP